ncbi:MAG: hypothetical protein JSR89_01740 [Proteobacteria bacterium]|nr:hypothetical protein [Pseudomonadota bacterium]
MIANQLATPVGFGRWTVDQASEGGAAADKGTANHMGDGLALLMAIFIELGSGLGLYIATTPWRVGSTAAGPEVSSPSLPTLMFDGPPLEAFAAECLHLKPGHQLQLGTAFETYREWCAKRNRSILSRTRFMRGLVRLAKELGLDADGTSLIVRDIALRKFGR